MPSQRLKPALPHVCAALLVACGSSGANPTGASNAGGAGGASSGQGGSPTGNAGEGSGGAGGANTSPSGAGIQLRLASTAASSVNGSGLNLLAFSSGGAVRPGLESLEFYIYSVQICESMDTSGSGFSNPGGCLALYSGDTSQLAYDAAGDWTPLGDAARALDTGFVDLIDASSRARLDATTELRSEHVRSYNYGLINWSLPVKVKATIPLGDGSFLYTHDGATESELISSDGYRHYYTRAGSSLASGPAEKAVVLLSSGGNWFKFQNPLNVTSADIEQQRQWVLDLVFNPEGIVKGFAGDGIGGGNLEEHSEQGMPIRAITVPLLDLAPIPHRRDEQVVRESYLANLNVSGQAFDVRLELYSVDGDPSRTIYGVDVKTLVVPESTSMPPEMMNVSYVVSQADGSLSFESYRHMPLISGFSRVAEELGSTQAAVSCGTHGDSDAANGGAALMLASCPSPAIDVTFRLVSRTLLDGEPPSVPPASDAGASDAGPQGDSGTDGGADAAP
ncbi:MAG TPA: hypothetical protein VNN80_12515 [Polyangiaceae bacterium]|nr:hypothetical protein [Polyangiaceae bacterium]